MKFNALRSSEKNSEIIEQFSLTVSFIDRVRSIYPCRCLCVCMRVFVYLFVVVASSLIACAAYLFTLAETQM